MLAGAVNIKFMADIMDLQSKMTQAQTSVSGAMGNIEKAVNQAKTALGALGIGLSAGAIVAHVKGIIDAADAMNDLSQRTGIAVKDLAKYELATAQSGTTMEALAKGIKGVSINLLEHGDALKKAGLSATNADAAMMQLADLFKAMPDGMEKTALAVKMFGKSGMDLIPMLNMGSDGLKEAADKSAKYAATMAALAPQADKFNDNLAELGMLSKIAGMSLMNDMLPALLRISQTMIDAKQNGQGFWETMNAGIWAFENEASKHLPGIFESYATAMPRQIANLKKELSDLQSEKGGLKMDLFGVGPKIDADIASTIKALAAAEEAYKKYLLTVNGPAGGDKGGSAVKPNTAIADWKAQYKAMMDAIKDTGGVKEAESEYDKLIKKLGIDVSNAAAAAEAAQNGYNKSQTEFVALKMGEVWAGLTEQQKEVVSKLFASKIASEQLADATKLIAKELEAYAAAQQKTISASYEELSKAQEAYDAHGKLASVIQEEVLARMQNNRQIMGGAGEDTAAITREIENKKKLIAILKSGEARDAGIKAAEDVAKEWQRGWEDTDRIAREAFTGWAENGTSMAETIGKSLKKAMLSAIYEATIKPIAFSIYSSMTGAPAGASALSQAGSAAGIYNAGSSLGFIGAGTSAFSAGASLQAAGMGTEAFAAGVEMMTSATGASSFMAGAGQALGAIGPVGWAALAAIAVLSLQDHGTPTQNTGNASASFDATGNRTAYQTYFGGSSANTDAMIGNMQLAYLAGAKSLGINAAATNFSYGSNTGKDSQNPMFALSGGAGASSYSLGETAYSDAAVSLAASRAVFSALQGSDLPQYLAKAFNGAVADTMTQDQITNTLNFASSLKQVREALLETREPLQILRDNVASGFADLHTSASTFKTDFVAAIDAGITPANLATWQALGSNMDQLAQATGTADTAVQALDRSLADVANERTRLQDQLDTLTMSTADLLAKQRSAIDASNQSLFDQVQVAQAAKTATDALAQSQKDAAAAAEALATVNQGWQDQLDILTGAQTDRSIALRDATDESTRALMRQVYAQQDLKTQADETAASLKAQTEQAAAAATQLAATNKTWQDQLDILTGAQTDRSIALRDATDESTRALMRQVYQQQDLKTASTAAADALAAVTTNAKALRDTAMSATNDALASVERAIAAQRKIEDAAVAAAQKQVDAVTSVFDVLQTQVKELQPMSAAAGNRWLDAALASGGTSDKQGLSDAIAAARSGLSNNNFSSAVDAQRATSLLANKLASLSNLTGAKLTDAQQQLKTATDAVAALDALLQTSRDQVTDAREGTLSIVDAISRLQTALVTELQALQTSFGDSLVTGFSSIDTSADSQISLAEFKAQFAGLASNATLEQVFGALDTNGSGLLSRLEAIKGSSFTTAQALELMRISAAGGLMGPAKTYTMTEMVAALKVAMSTGASPGAVVNAANVNYGILPADVASVAAITGNTAVQAAAVAAQATRHAVGGALGGARDYTMSELENALTVVITQQHYDVATAILGAWQNWGIYEADVRAAGKAAGLPGFAQGTNYVVADMQAQIHEGERIMPRADNELLMQRLQSPQTNNQVLVAAIRAMQDETKALRQEVAKLRAENSAENRAIAISSAKAASALDDSKAGGRWINVKVVTP